MSFVCFWMIFSVQFLQNRSVDGLQKSRSKSCNGGHVYNSFCLILFTCCFLIFSKEHSSFSSSLLTELFSFVLKQHIRLCSTSVTKTEGRWASYSEQRSGGILFYLLDVRLGEATPAEILDFIW